MGNFGLPINVDTTYGDNPNDASVKLHQQHHDTIHGAIDAFDTAFATGSTGDVLTRNSSGLIALAAPPSGGGGGASPATEVFSSGLSGADDDAKHATFISTYLGTTAYKPTLILDERKLYQYNVQRQLSDGYAISGGYRGLDQARAVKPIPQEVKIRTTGGLYTLPAGNVFGCYFGNLSIDGSSTNRFIDGHATGTLWQTNFHNISCQNSGGMLGSSAQKLLMTGVCSFSGVWNVNNMQEPFIVVGGSDMFFTPTALALDTGALLAASKYLARFQSVSNCWVANWYITADGASAFEITGGSTDESMWILDCVFEGRNDTEYCPGALIRMGGGQVMIKDSRFAFAMANPTAPGRSPTDAGVIHQTSGTLAVRDCSYRRQSTVAESVPFVYAIGSSTVVDVSGIVRQGTWTGKPLVRVEGGATAYVDDSVTATADSTSKIIHTGGDSVGQNFQTGTSYTATLLDQGRIIDINNAGTHTLTLPVLPADTMIRARRYGAGAVNIVGSGVTVRGLSSIATQYGEVRIHYRTTTEAVVV
jgi:hypothetical protein